MINLKIKNLNKGFTLVELLIVIAIIGVLASLLMANFVGVRQRARDAQRKSDLRQIQSALEFYRSDLGVYPTSPLTNCGGALSGGAPSVTYMTKIPCDPQGGNYSYNSAGSSYSLTACIENNSDAQKDSSKYASCSTASFTVNNP